ncbi:Os04g0205101, partial [Oryza sativa Japonica Group]
FDAVLGVIRQITDLADPRPHHIVLDPFPIGGLEEGLHHLELILHEHSITLHDLPQLLFLLDGALDLVYKCLNHRLGDPNGKVCHCSLPLSVSQVLFVGVVEAEDCDPTQQLE